MAAATETVTSTAVDLSTGEKCVAVSTSGSVGASFPGGTPHGTIPITKAGVAVITIPLPVSGVDDGKTLTFFDQTGNAHTVSTPANGINGNKLTATFGGTLGQFLTLRAYKGVWYTLAAASGITLS